MVYTVGYRPSEMSSSFCAERRQRRIYSFLLPDYQLTHNLFATLALTSRG